VATNGWLARHLALTYGADVAAMERLDDRVFRVDRRDGPTWVARLFGGPAAGEVQGQVDILRALQAGEFPAERCAAEEPVSWYDNTAVLVTNWVDGQPSDAGGRTYAYLGGLLGALHAHDGAGQRIGGAWHHLSPTGGPRAEIDAAIRLLEESHGAAEPSDQFVEILDALGGLDDCADAPQALVHADAVPSNAISTPDDKRVIVDWAGAGRGPRLWSIGFTLWAAASRSPKLVGAVMSRYRRHVQLSHDELGRLANVIAARPLTIDVWSYANQRLPLVEVLRRWHENQEIAVRTAEQIQRATQLD
jgi:Ser/Thr protein kinase RdoA (MazF antagonist)